MRLRFVVTGSGRCRTKWVSEALTRAGVPCGHEAVFGPHEPSPWSEEPLLGDSSWMAATMLDEIQEPVALLVRHPLAVIQSWVDIGFFSHDTGNPTHGPLRRFAPELYAPGRSPADQAAGMWHRLTYAGLIRAEMVLRVEQFDTWMLARLIGWAGGQPRNAALAYAETPPCNRHELSREIAGAQPSLRWSDLSPDEARPAAELAKTLGYGAMS